MTDNKIRGLEKIRRDSRFVGAVALGMMIGGGFLGLFATGFVGGLATMIDNNHLTDPDTPVSELENATYTFSPDDIIDDVWQFSLMMIAGVTIMVSGLIVVAALPDSKDLHIAICKGHGEVRYCPECGLRLPRLEER